MLEKHRREMKMEIALWILGALVVAFLIVRLGLAWLLRKPRY
jgi:hypothetical protein